MKKHIYAFFTTAFLYCMIIPQAVFAQSGPIVNSPFLYEVSKGSVKSYIFGTIHVGLNSSDLPSSVVQAFQNVHLVAVEWMTPENVVNGILTDPVDTYVSLIRGLPNSQLPGNPLTEVQKQSLISQWGVSPKLVAVMTTQACSLLRFGNTVLAKGPLDYYIEQMAYNSGKPMIQLDTQKLISAAKADEATPQLACDMGRAIAEGPNQYWASTMTDLTDYLSGDESKLGQSNDPLIVDRNKAWLPILQSKLGSESTFVAVGARHLPGPNGLLQMLEAAGFMVRRLP